MQKYKETTTILGIDPGYARVGYGIIKKQKGEIKYITSGLLKTPSNNFTQGIYLLDLERDLKRIIQKHKPNLGAVEELFFLKNKKTFVKVLQARGVILKVLSEYKIKIMEVKPQEMKLALTTYGRANKKDIAKMVGLILNINTSNIIDDETDALALAITAANKHY